MKNITYMIYEIREDDLNQVYEAVDDVLEHLKDEHLIGDYESEES